MHGINERGERLLIHCFLVNMSEHSPGRQTFTVAVAEPSPDNALRWPEKKAKCSNGLCKGSSKEISWGAGATGSQCGGILWFMIIPQGLFCTLYSDRPSTEVCEDRRVYGWLMNSSLASQADRLQLPRSWSTSWARLLRQSSVWVCQGVFLRN